MIRDRDLVEHVMRVATPERARILLGSADVNGWKAALGIHMDSLAPTALAPKTPLASQLTGRAPSRKWRSAVPAARGSAWEELEFLRVVTGDGHDGNPMDELERLRFDHVTAE